MSWLNKKTYQKVIQEMELWPDWKKKALTQIQYAKRTCAGMEINMKTLDVTYDENFYKEQDQKSDKVFNAPMKFLSNLVILFVIFVLSYFLVSMIPNTTIRICIEKIEMLVFIATVIVSFLYPVSMMQDGNIPYSLDSAVALKETYDKKPELLFMESQNGEWFILLDVDELVYIPLQEYLKIDFKYEAEIPKEWETLLISVTNDGASTVSFT